MTLRKAVLRRVLQALVADEKRDGVTTSREPDSNVFDCLIVAIPAPRSKGEKRFVAIAERAMLKDHHHHTQSSATEEIGKLEGERRKRKETRVLTTVSEERKNVFSLSTLSSLLSLSLLRQIVGHLCSSH